MFAAPGYNACTRAGRGVVRLRSTFKMASIRRVDSTAVAKPAFADIVDFAIARRGARVGRRASRGYRQFALTKRV